MFWCLCAWVAACWPLLVHGAIRVAGWWCSPALVCLFCRGSQLCPEWAVLMFPFCCRMLFMRPSLPSRLLPLGQSIGLCDITIVSHNSSHRTPAAQRACGSLSVLLLMHVPCARYLVIVGCGRGFGVMDLLVLSPYTTRMPRRSIQLQNTVRSAAALGTDRKQQQSCRSCM